MEKDTQNLYHGSSLYLFAKCKIMIYDYDKVDIILDNSIKILANNDDHYFFYQMLIFINLIFHLIMTNLIKLKSILENLLLNGAFGLHYYII